MYKSKYTCKHRHPSQHVRAWNFTHSPDCYYAEVLKQERQAREDRRRGEALFLHYRRTSRNERNQNTPLANPRKA